jgi:DNA-binding GntR family transcriptional regulator
VSFQLSHLEHRLLVEALADRRAVDAEEVLRMHIRRTFEALARDWDPTA